MTGDSLRSLGMTARIPLARAACYRMPEPALATSLASHYRIDRELGAGGMAERKKWVVYEGGHDVPRTELIKETLGRLDTYLGPVR
jgi:hypothetical protein